jgi:hypothetical protein
VVTSFLRKFKKSEENEKFSSKERLWRIYISVGKLRCLAEASQKTGHRQRPISRRAARL